MAPNQSHSSPGANATAQAKAKLDEFRRRAASRSTSFGHPGITLGPSFAGPYGPGTPPFAFPGQPVVPGDTTPSSNAGPSLFQSLGTMLRLSIDLFNSGLQGFLASGSYSSSSGGGCGCNYSCEESCCAQYAPEHGCGCGCGCGCNPSVRNCP